MVRFRLMALFVLAMAAGMGLTATASASSVTNPSAVPYQSFIPVTQVTAGSHGGLVVFLNPATALGGGDKVTITGPTGTNFSGLTDAGFINTMNNETTSSGSSSNIPTPVFSNGGRTVIAEVPGSVSVASGEQLRVSLSAFQNLITFGTASGNSSFEVSTNKDTTAAATPPYQTNPAAPDSFFLIDGPQHTAFNQIFNPMRIGVEDQYSNLIPGQNVSATVAPSGSSGTFPGGATVAQVTTGPDGTATLPRITANSQIGSWHLDLVGPGGINDFYEMNNLAYANAANVNLSLAPSSIPADGSSTTVATATVTDQFGNPVPDRTLVLSSSNGQPTGTVVDNGDGTYTGQVTATTTSGQSTITATDGLAQYAISGTATLTQTALPAKSVAVTLNPSKLAADGKSTTSAKAFVTDMFGNAASGAQVIFSSDGGQAIGSVSESSDGSYTATITASKSAGTSQIFATVAGASPAVTGSASLSQTAVKAITPVLKFKKPPKKMVNSAKVTFRFKVVKGKAKGFQCKLDRKKWTKCKSPKKVKLKPGRHVFKVRGVATDGAFGKPITRKVKRMR